MRFAFISRHTPTASQFALARAEGIELIHVGDADAFEVTPQKVKAMDGGPFSGVVVVHPAAALQLCDSFDVGVFENSNRAPVGQKPEFYAKSLKIWRLPGPGF